MALGGCAAVVQGYQQAENEKKVAETKAQADTMAAECYAKYPKQRGQYLNRVRCLRPAQDLYLPIAPYRPSWSGASSLA